MQLTALGGHGPGQDRLPGRLHDVIPVTRKPGKRNIRNQLGGELRHREDGWRITTRTPLHTVSADRSRPYITPLPGDGGDRSFIHAHGGHERDSSPAVSTHDSADVIFTSLGTARSAAFDESR